MLHKTHTNFTACSQAYTTSPTYISQYHWSGPIHYIERNFTSQISLHGCETLCGTGTELYPWIQIASTITTWVLPAMGIIVQAPFESNRNWRTIRCLARWIGSPISSMTYILWNINITGRCAMLVDMATSYGDGPALDNADFLDIRDSFYLLSAMNQFVMDKDLDHTAGQNWTEGLLRVVLFSRDLKLNRLPDCSTDRRLQELREETACYLRTHRKRGVVPVIVSIIWFVIAMGISIQSAFGDLGKNAAGHDLAIGLLLAWLPLLMLATIVDRNFISAGTVRDYLNELIYETAIALSKCQLRTDRPNPDVLSWDYIGSLRAEMCEVNPCDISKDIRESWENQMDALVQQCREYVRPDPGDHEKKREFFRDFSGQARVRRHHGAANTILVSIEQEYVVKKGRDWLLSNGPAARLNLVLARSPYGLLWYDKRELIQMTGATFIVASTVMGAFVLSYCVPTVGLGCRSGSYMIFLIVAFSLQMIETSTWAMVVFWRSLESLRYRQYDYDLLSRWTLFVVKVLRSASPGTGVYAARLGQVDAWFFGILESSNALALVIVVLLQTIGGFQTCACQASIWSNIGGYIDFNNYSVTEISITKHGWIAGTVVSCAVLTLTLSWIVIQWTIQSHISTEELHDARTGLESTRRFIRFVYVYIWPFVRFRPVIGIAWHGNNGTGSLRSGERLSVSVSNRPIELQRSPLITDGGTPSPQKDNTQFLVSSRSPPDGSPRFNHRHQPSPHDSTRLLAPDSNSWLGHRRRGRSGDSSHRSVSSERESYTLPELSFQSRSGSPFPPSDHEDSVEASALSIVSLTDG